MNNCVTHTAPEPVFDQPWHAQVFAVTVALNEAGRFAWSDWAARFADTLKRNGIARDLDGGDDYFQAWLETLEDLLADQGAAPPQDVKALHRAWEDAYLTTPHGQPVHLR
ncbi:MULTISPECIES: nitrile hydratase accessory protein [unclassified Ruegeria]|uniref:nitrile hydratase accessory protein n=1 Tax=unclassified Ruegeria TaxID=2625375 RepID=UPI001489E501|nr:MULTISPECIES: nitrile hydratase accessory protein [unclassified Ruegeria]NOD33851.1 nitrile hydratase accessory protein [Ruegeria sp. HKCCD7296]NOD45832.1 nitrile hydratase accessory protein [Ruegeria sp. HKCCD5849]NOD50868.1 nitrile hydratase accessory protein [Ruegeria sp. HKCCD5851]NOD67675.1 nitrile hydratase accessory protein [Ruegeria sp. HKCCD7303]NOE33252.1 nitrile hydratase accessory protein [Ruegeria sp. HKCCD7318]